MKYLRQVAVIWPHLLCARFMCWCMCMYRVGHNKWNRKRGSLSRDGWQYDIFDNFIWKTYTCSFRICNCCFASLLVMDLKHFLSNSWFFVTTFVWEQKKTGKNDKNNSLQGMLYGDNKLIWGNLHECVLSWAHKIQIVEAKCQNHTSGGSI